MRPVTTTVGPLASASATNIRTASAIAGAGAVTLNGTLVSTGSSVAHGVIIPAGTAVLDTARRVIFTSSGNDTGITFSVTGTDNAGNAQSETVTGASGGAASTVLSYKTFAPPVASGAAAGTVSIGTNGVAASPWVRLDNWAPGGVAIQCTVTGTVNYTVQQTLDDPNSATSPVVPASVTWVDSADTAVVGATATKQSNYAFAPAFARVLLNSGSGSVRATFTQLGTPAR